jgi:hypothetical protein
VSRTIRPDLIRGGPNAGGNPEYRTLAGVGDEVEAAPAAGRYLWEVCKHKIARTVIIAAGLGLIAATAASAQMAPGPKPEHLRGTVEKVDGNVITAKSRDGATVTIKLADNARVVGMAKAQLSDIKQGNYIGVTAMPQADGSQKAIGLHIFMDAQRGAAEGFRPWDREPGSTMTNANVDSVVTGVDGQTITVKYKDGEKKVIVPPNTPVVRFTPGTKDDVKAGAQFFIVAAVKQADGTYTAAAINVGRDGAAPPM